MKLRALHCLAWLASFALIGCGGAPPEPKEPEPVAKAEPEPAPAEEEEAEPEEEAPAEEPEPAPEEPTLKRSPKDIVTEENILFAFSFRDSDAYSAAEARCDKKSGDDPKKRADCLRKEGDKVAGDSMFFKQGGGKWWWTIIRRSGKKVTVLTKLEIEFGEETDTSVTILPKGRDTGKKPMRPVPKKVVIEVEDGSLILSDPKKGKMVYNPKAGLVQ